MTTLVGMILSVLLFSAVRSPAAVAAVSVDRLEEKVEDLLSQSSRKTKVGRYYLAGVGLVGGSILTGLGIYSVVDDNQNFAGPGWVAIGGMYFGSGLAGLIFESSPEKVWKEFQALPKKSKSDRLVRVGRGEGYLQTIAQQAYYSRMVFGVFLMGAGTGSLVGAGLAASNSSKSLMYALLISGASLLVLSPISFFFPTHQEDTWTDYKQWKKSKGQAFRRTTPLWAKIRPSFGVVPDGEGNGGIAGFGQLSLRF